jgi:hypothetical protein
MMSRTEQNWPDEQTVEIPTDEPTEHSGSLITDLESLVEQTEKESNDNQNGN